MNKLLATLIASFFAVSTAFAASHVGAPMATASGAKMEKKDGMAKDGMAKDGMAKDGMAKDGMAKDGMADKKAMKKKTKKAKKDGMMKEEKKS